MFEEFKQADIKSFEEYFNTCVNPTVLGYFYYKLELILIEQNEFKIYKKQLDNFVKMNEMERTFFLYNFQNTKIYIIFLQIHHYLYHSINNNNELDCFEKCTNIGIYEKDYEHCENIIYLAQKIYEKKLYAKSLCQIIAYKKNNDFILNKDVLCLIFSKLLDVSISDFDKTMKSLFVKN